MKTLFDFLDHLVVREPAVHGNLAVYPVFDDHSPTLDYLTLEEALAAGGVKVGEVGGGSVPELLLSNGTAHRVLLLDGEELVGAKQNRILNTSILVEAGSEIRIPVSCVEHGRWDRGVAMMKSSEVAYPKLRAMKAHQVHESLKAAGLYRSDQGAVWAEIAQFSEGLRDYAPTGRMEAVYEVARDQLEETLRRLPCCPGACGVVAVIAGRIACADVFDSPSTLEKLWARLLTSYALDAHAAAPAPQTAAQAGQDAAPAPVSTLPPEQVARFLRLEPDTPVEAFASPGIGQSLRFRTPDRAGCALAFAEAVVHLEVFPAEEGQGAGWGGHEAYRPTRIARPSQRASRRTD